MAQILTVRVLMVRHCWSFFDISQLTINIDGQALMDLDCQQILIVLVLIVHYCRLTFELRVDGTNLDGSILTMNC